MHVTFSKPSTLHVILPAVVKLFVPPQSPYTQPPPPARAARLLLLQKIVGFGADGRSQLVSADTNGTVTIWDLGGGRDAMARHAHGHHNRGGDGGKGNANKATRDFLPELGGGGVNKHQALPLVARCGKDPTIIVFVEEHRTGRNRVALLDRVGYMISCRGVSRHVANSAFSLFSLPFAHEAS